jgi:hypothetical protein
MILLLVACGGSASKPAPEVPPATPAPTVATPNSETPSSPAAEPEREKTLRGLWAVPDRNGRYVGVSMRVEPGEPLDSERWRFDFAGMLINCRPQISTEAWTFEDCSGLPAGTTFRAVMPVAGNSGFSVTFRSGGGQGIEAEFVRVPERVEPQSSSNVDLVWHYPGENYGIWAEDGFVFSPSSRQSVVVLDAATGALVSEIDVRSAGQGRGGGLALEVKAREGILYVATVTRGLLIFDVRQPATPRFLGQYMVDAGPASQESFTNVHNLFISPRGDIVYAVNQSHAATDLRFIDVRDPTRPVEAGRFLLPRPGNVLDGFHDLNVIERDGRLIAFVNALRSGFFILDVTEPRQVSILGSLDWEGTLSHAGWPFEVGGRLYYAHGDEGWDQGLRVLDITDLRDPREVSEFKTRPGISIHNIEVVGTEAYIAYYLDGLRVVDLSDPARPREVGHYDTVPSDLETELFQGAWGVRFLDGLVFISDSDSGVYAFRVHP